MVTATNPMPPTQWGYDKNLKDAPNDIDKAKALLKQARRDGFDLTLWAMPVQRPDNPNARLMAEMLQSDWGEIGVKVKYWTTSGASTSAARMRVSMVAMLIRWY